MTQTLEPKTVEEVAESVRSTGSRAIATVGSGTALGLGNPASREDIALQMRGLDRIVDYVPEDQVVVVEAGVTLSELQNELGKRGQRLALDPVGGDGATIGGMLATNAYGPRALRYGTLKDLIVGVELVRADGVVAHAGGKVVKNVAGFDVSKLIVGSLGTLAIITKATFRVHPLPEKTTRLAFNTKLEHVFPFVLALRESQLEPAAIAVHLNRATNAGGAEATIEVVFEGFGPGVDAQSVACEDAASRVTLSIASAASEVEGQRKYRFKATFPPAEFARVAREIEGEALTFPSLGAIYFGGPSTTGAQGAPYARDDTSHQSLERAQELRAIFESLGGTLVVQDMPDEWRGEIDAWGTPPPAFKLMRALKERFDPHNRLNPGRFVGGL
ncbi:MAG TPA: FAD-binding oxidoreductase [Candidatus Baltobacteraceae bacterium]|jgi:glycolate oxidase FAD binding subunit